MGLNDDVYICVAGSTPDSFRILTEQMRQQSNAGVRAMVGVLHGFVELPSGVYLARDISVSEIDLLESLVEGSFSPVGDFAKRVKDFYDSEQKTLQ